MTGSAGRSVWSAEAPARLAVVCPTWVGDGLMALPALQAWAARHPGAAWTAVAKPPAMPLWAIVPEAADRLAWPATLGGLRTAARDLRRRRPDAAVIFPNSVRSALLAWLARIPCRRGFPGHGRRGLLTDVVAAPAAPVHQVEEGFRLLGLPAPSPLPPARLEVPSSARAAAAARMGDAPRPWLAVMPGAGRGPAKRWAPERFVAAAREFHRQFGGTTLWMGAAGDESPLRAAGVGGDGRDRMLCGGTAFAEWAALLEAADAALANDSGGAHLAATLGVPLVAIFGATDPRITAPIGPRVRVVQAGGPGSRAVARRSGEATRRLDAVSVDEVARALLAVYPPQP